MQPLYHSRLFPEYNNLQSVKTYSDPLILNSSRSFYQRSSLNFHTQGARWADQLDSIQPLKDWMIVQSYEDTGPSMKALSTLSDES
jgi:hypothetical protein